MPSIAVSNFGPIGHAEVELKPLTVFIGANNTGKSYLALVAYSLSRAIAGTRGVYDMPWRTRRPYRRRLWLGEGLSRRFRRAIGGVRGQLPGIAELGSRETEFREWPPKVQNWMRRESNSWASQLSDHVDYELRRCFGSSLSQMGRRNQQAQPSEFSISLTDKSTGLNWDLGCRNDQIVTQKWESAEPQDSIKLNPRRVLPRALLSEDVDIISQVLLWSYADVLLAGYSSPSHYLPASRTGILQGHKTLASLIVDRASSAWIEPMEVERLPGVITDLIRALLLLERGSQPSKRLIRIVEYLEKNVVDGTINIEKQVEYPVINYTSFAGAFQLHQVSSMVSEIAPLILFLKYLVKPGDFLIFEEPESHLDAVNQSRLARAIAMMVNGGVRVLVTTHSDIFLNQINNVMQASQLPPRQRLRMGYKAVEVLQPTETAAYVFEHSRDGTQVSPLNIDSDQGLLTESFDVVHRALYNEAIRMEH